MAAPARIGSTQPARSSFTVRPQQHAIIDTYPYFGYYGGIYDPYPWASSYYSVPYYSVPTAVDPSYVVPEYVQPQYAQPQYVQPSPSPNDANLAFEVERLRLEVERLRQDQADTTQRLSSRPLTPASEKPATPMTLVLRDGRRFYIQSYAIAGQTLWIVDGQKSAKVLLSDVDLDATAKTNPGTSCDFLRPRNK